MSAAASSAANILSTGSRRSRVADLQLRAIDDDAAARCHRRRRLRGARAQAAQQRDRTTLDSLQHRSGTECVEAESAGSDSAARPAASVGTDASRRLRQQNQRDLAQEMRLSSSKNIIYKIKTNKE